MARGQRSGRGSGGRHRGARPAQPTAAPPSGDALHVELRASPEFFKALKGRECPAAAAEGSSSSGPSPMGTSLLQMEQWKDLDRLLGWFRDGIKADPLAELAFSSKLTKSQRASVHGTATAVGLGGLGTASRGVGEGRCVVVLAKQRAVRPELSEKQDQQAFWTWRWAGQRGLQVSRDEVAEMLLGSGLTPELQAIWDEQSTLQKAVQQLCGAVAAGDAAAVAAAVDAQPRLLKDGVFDVQTGVAPLHLAAREGRAELVQLLLSKGAAVDGLDGHGWTPLQVARKYEQSDAEGVLLRAGAHDPDKGKSILDRPAAAPEAPLANGTKPAAPAAGAAAAAAAASPSVGSGPLSDTGSQDVYIDSVASVCGTERDNLAAEVGSNADDYADPQYQAPSASQPSPAIEEGDEAENTEAAAESARAQAEAVALAAKAAAEAEAAAVEAAAEEAAAREAAAAAAATAAQAFAAARAAAEEEAGMEEEGTAEDDGEEEDDDDDEEEAGLSADEEGELAEEAAGEAKISAVRAFSAALAAAEAAEAAAEAAEAWPGEEGAQRAAAFRREAEAAVAAAAAAAVVVGDALDGVLPPPQDRAPPPPPPSSAASVCGSDATARSPLPEASESGSGPLSSSGSAPAQAPPAESATTSQQHAEAQEEAAPAQQAAAAAGEAALAGGAGAAAAAAAAAASAAGRPEVAPQAPAEAAERAVGDVHAVAATAAEHTANAGKGAAAAASWAASRARAELEALAPEWSQWIDQKAPEVAHWVQEHPGSVIAGAGLVAAGLAALLYGTRRR